MKICPAFVAIFDQDVAGIIITEAARDRFCHSVQGIGDLFFAAPQVGLRIAMGE